PWTRESRREDRQGGFRHVSAAKLWSIVAARKEMNRNQTAINYKLGDIVALSKGEVKTESIDGKGGQSFAGDQSYIAAVNEWVALQTRIHRAGILHTSSEPE